MKTITKTVLYLQMTALLLTAALAGPAAAEKEVPFRGSIQGVEIADVQFPKLFVDASGSGNATHLGRFTVTYEVGGRSPHRMKPSGPVSSQRPTETASPLTLQDSALRRRTPMSISIVEVHTITGGTGRFAGATGSFIRTSLLNLVTGFTSGSFDGTIVLNNAN